MKRKILRKFGFKKDQQGIINRYLRENGGWDSHLNNTKNFILKCSENKEKNSCVILGSGWLLDVPIEQLIDSFEQIYLIDIVHPRQIIHKYKKQTNIIFIETDIAGYIETVYFFLKEKKKQKAALTEIQQHYTNEFSEIIKNASMVVSVNILNQLDILICDYIAKTNIYSKEEIYLFRKLIQQKHLELLPANKSCIITDYEELNYNDQMQLTQQKPLVHVHLPNNKETVKWRWNFDMNKTYHNNYKTVFKVMAWEK